MVLPRSSLTILIPFVSPKNTKLILAAVLITSAVGCGPTEDGESTAPPNFVFVLIDDLGWADLPAYGHTFHETPNIDRLAAEGLRFINAYAAAPVCSPTRASIFSPASIRRAWVLPTS